MKPERIILMRHGESLEDVDNTIYREIIDREIPLTDVGVEQVISTIPFIRHEILSKHLTIWHCSSVRIKQTVELVSKGLEGFSVSCVEDARLAKQNWGTVTLENRDFHERQRYRVGVLKYQFPDGEAGIHVVERIRQFLEEFFNKNTGGTHLICNHGFVFRILSTFLTGWNEEYFLCLANPGYADVRVFDRNSKTGLYVINKPMKLYNKEKNKFHIDAKR